MPVPPTIISYPLQEIVMQRGDSEWQVILEFVAREDESGEKEVFWSAATTFDKRQIGHGNKDDALRQIKEFLGELVLHGAIPTRVEYFGDIRGALRERTSPLDVSKRVRSRLVETVQGRKGARPATKRLDQRESGAYHSFKRTVLTSGA